MRFGYELSIPLRTSLHLLLLQRIRLDFYWLLKEVSLLSNWSRWGLLNLLSWGAKGLLLRLQRWLRVGLLCSKCRRFALFFNRIRIELVFRLFLRQINFLISAYFLLIPLEFQINVRHTSADLIDLVATLLVWVWSQVRLLRPHLTPGTFMLKGKVVVRWLLRSNFTDWFVILAVIPVVLLMAVA